MKTNLKRVATASVLLLGVLALLAANVLSQDSKPGAEEPAAEKLAQKEVTVDLDKAVKVGLPMPPKELEPAAFETPDGREGWVIRIPGGRPIATPAYSDGMIFVGGGYGSFEFYAFDAKTGAVVWKMRTKDDGPTAAVVEDGHVAFNTESCTVVVAEAKTGKIVWEEWLGDPLMSQPAIAKGRLYMAYPGGQRGQFQGGGAAPPRGKPLPPGHRMLCADLKTGRHLWETPITADVITAPVVSGDKVYFTCHDGTSFCLGALDGEVRWKKQNAGTSAPLVADGQVVMTRREKRGEDAVEGIARLDPEAGEQKDEGLIAEGKADYLKPGAGGGVAMGAGAQAEADAGVGFGSAPGAANLGATNSNLGVGTVVGGWAYQGSRAAQTGGRLVNGQGRYLNCLSNSGATSYWRATALGKGITDGVQVFSPPSVGKENLYLCTGAGHLLSVGRESGETGFLYATGHGMVFQPALAEGNVYAGTVDGLLICLKIGGKDADGWYAWGGNAQHNKAD